MPLEHSIDAQRNFLVTRVRGAITSDDLIRYLTAVKQDRRLRPGYLSLFDLGEALPGDLAGDAVRRAAEVARRFDERTGPVRVAVVAPSDVAFGMARMYGALVDGLQREVRVFREAREAEAWLCGSAPEDGVAA